MEYGPRAASRPDLGPALPPGRAEQVRGEHPHAEQGVAVPRPRRMPERHSVRDQVLAALRSALVTGELEPGGVYSAPALAERFGVSATPVREAMQLLAREGAVEAMPNRGFRVAERSARERAELAEVRALLEVPVVVRLARTLPAERWEALRPYAEATVAAAALGDRAAYAEADRAFHRAMLELSGNRQLVAVADELHRRAQWPVAAARRGHATTPSGRRTGTVSAELAADAGEHAVLLEALVAGDVATAESLVREHFTGR
ncbi:GntR family transcriptional regulator [Actinacidiphila soli]|uniref:GntR family transcriptional regulator n=1 Tax=Actinacidiphila soli TaxID=2487275 RepID=UPI0038992430